MLFVTSPIRRVEQMFQFLQSILAQHSMISAPLFSLIVLEKIIRRLNLKTLIGKLDVGLKLQICIVRWKILFTLRADIELKMKRHRQSCGPYMGESRSWWSTFGRCGEGGL